LGGALLRVGNAAPLALCTLRPLHWSQELLNKSYELLNKGSALLHWSHELLNKGSALLYWSQELLN